MREIKFRAKRTDGLGWVYGYFVKTPITAEWNDNREGGHFFDSGRVGRYCIITEHGVAHEIDIKTLGQFTGLKDKNGKEIYEGDIVQIGVGIYQIIWYHNRAAWWIAHLSIQFNKDEEIETHQSAGTPVRNWSWLNDGEKVYWHDPKADPTKDSGRTDYVEIIGNVWENPELLK